MGMNEEGFQPGGEFEITGPGEYDVNVVLYRTADETKAKEYYDSLVERRHRVSKSGLLKNPYRLYKTSKELVSEMDISDL